MIGFGQSSGEYFATVAINLGRQASLFFKGAMVFMSAPFPGIQELQEWSGGT